MLDATPPQPDPGPPQRDARTTAHTGAPRKAFVLSLLSVIGVAVAAVMARWAVINWDHGFNYVATIGSGMMIVLGVSFALAVMSLGMSVPWRRAGGRGWLSILSTAFAAIAILGVAVGYALIAFEVIAFALIFSKI